MLDKLLSDLKALWLARRREVAAEHKRSLPLADYVVDRWEKAAELGFGKGTSIYDSVLVIGDVTVGRDTWIGPFVVLDGSGGLSIGSNCSISAGVHLYSHDTVQWAVTGGGAPYEYAPTVVGDNCYVGPNVVVVKGVRLGKGCLVGANSVVLADIPEGMKAAGNPCRILGPVKETS
jgi:acetyltransferase-like isoleucine patch superfamily enzyme